MSCMCISTRSSVAREYWFGFARWCLFHAHLYALRYGMARGLICSIRAARSDSAAAISFVASFAVLLFEPHTTMPPSHYATAVAIRLRSEWIAI